MSKSSKPLAVNGVAHEAGLTKALESVFAVIQFSPKGRIITANQNFLDLMGYELDEIVGGHHRMFVDSVYARSPEYADFWARLGAGENLTGEYKRLRKDGAPVYLKASYMSVRGTNGQLDRVMKVALDYTQDKLRSLDAEGKLQGIDRSQATVEFTLDGRVLTANRNFLDVMGYSLNEIKGEHHSMFVDTAYSRSQAYRDFWHDLNQGKRQSAEFKRIGKNGREVWLQATYDPILDLDDRPIKVVKYATDITEQKKRNLNYQSQIEAINNTQAVVEFNIDGEVLEANPVFLSTMGYTVEEVRGRHHRMFVDPEYAQGAEYLEFWRQLKDGRPQQGEFLRVAKDGTKRWLQASYTPIPDLDGNFRKVIKYAVDLSAERRLRDSILDDLERTIAGLAAAPARFSESPEP